MWGQGSFSFFGIWNYLAFFITVLVPMSSSCVRKSTFENNILKFFNREKGQISLFPFSSLVLSKRGDLELASVLFFLQVQYSPHMLILQADCLLLGRGANSSNYRLLLSGEGKALSCVAYLRPQFNKLLWQLCQNYSTFHFYWLSA